MRFTEIVQLIAGSDIHDDGTSVCDNIFDNPTTKAVRRFDRSST